VGLSILPRYENKIKNEAPLQMNYNEKGASVFLVAFLTTKYLLYNIYREGKFSTTRIEKSI